MKYVRARFRDDTFTVIACFTHHTEDETLIYPMSCVWLPADVGNRAKTISAHSQIIIQRGR
jgi:hypothetical protein